MNHSGSCSDTHGFLERYSDYSGIEVCVKEGSAHDYLFIRKEHLKAVSVVLTSEGFDHLDDSTQASLRFLTNALCEEISHLIPIALKEAYRRAVTIQKNPAAQDRTSASAT